MDGLAQSEPLSADGCRAAARKEAAAPGPHWAAALDTDGLHARGCIVNGGRRPYRMASCDVHHFRARLSRRRPSAHSDSLTEAVFARAAESPRTPPAYTEWAQARPHGLWLRCSGELDVLRRSDGRVLRTLHASLPEPPSRRAQPSHSRPPAGHHQPVTRAEPYARRACCLLGLGRRQRRTAIVPAAACAPAHAHGRASGICALRGPRPAVRGRCSCVSRVAGTWFVQSPWHRPVEPSPWRRRRRHRRHRGAVAVAAAVAASPTYPALPHPALPHPTPSGPPSPSPSTPRGSGAPGWSSRRGGTRAGPRCCRRAAPSVTRAGRW